MRSVRSQLRAELQDTRRHQRKHQLLQLSILCNCKQARTLVVPNLSYLQRLQQRAADRKLHQHVIGDATDII
jgi:hypothetical protein